jgi:hypothetical protein
MGSVEGKTVANRKRFRVEIEVEIDADDAVHASSRVAEQFNAGKDTRVFDRQIVVAVKAKEIKNA